MNERQVREKVERLAEVNRQKKLFEEEAKDLQAVLIGELDGRGVTSWADDFFRCSIVEQEGRTVADVKALEADGLSKYLRKGDPFRYLRAGAR